VVAAAQSQQITKGLIDFEVETGIPCGAATMLE